MLLLFALSLALQSKLEGVIVDKRSQPVAGARVILGELGHATLFYTAPEELFVATPGLPESEAKAYAAMLTTDANGHFAAEGLALGEYSLIAAEPATGIACTTLRLERDSNERYVLQRPATVNVTLAGLAFDPRVDVLALEPRNATANLRVVPRLVREDGAWSFRSVGLPALAEWRIVGAEVVPERDFSATLFNLPLDAAPREETRASFQLDAGAVLSGRVVDASGAAARGVALLATSREDPPRQRGTVSDAEGRYRIAGLAPGNWKLDAARFEARAGSGCGSGAQEQSAEQSFSIAAEPELSLDIALSACRPPPKPGERAREFAADTLDHGVLQLSELQGKVVLLQFWSAGCALCPGELPRLVTLYGELAPSERFEIVGVSLDEDQEQVRRFVASRGLRWPQTALGSAAKNPIARLYNVHATPATVLIAPDGLVVATQLSGEPLRAKIDELLAAK